MTLSLLVGLILLLLVLAWVVRPLVVARQARLRLTDTSETAALEELLFAREAALLAIRDLQQDHTMGKLSEADFAELDARYRAHAIELLRQLDELGVSADEEPSADSLDEWIEQAVAEVRAGTGGASRRLGPASEAAPEGGA